MTIVTLLFLSESHAPTIQRKREREGVTCSTDMPVTNATERKKLLIRSLIRPIRMLTQSPIVAGLSLYLALIYGYLYLLFTTFSTIFPQQYGFSTETLGLAFLGMGVGQLLALLVLSWLSDWLQESLTKRYGKAKPEYLSNMPSARKKLLTCVVDTDYCLSYLEYHYFQSVYLCMDGPPNIESIGWFPSCPRASLGQDLYSPFLFSTNTSPTHATNTVKLPTQIYMIDAFTAFAASALAATSIVRSIVGGILPMAGLPLYEALGYGWCTG
ncbi:hypothetical protein MKX08_000017 [Trichoderma sp. CBMAI-0020]|nr:hypothetical protein MKX08_000017 [Trichoderma sp. CBMAI-0020]